MITEIPVKILLAGIFNTVLVITEIIMPKKLPAILFDVAGRTW